MEYCTGLTKLELGNNQISDIKPLADLTKLTWLSLHNNAIEDIEALERENVIIYCRTGRRSRIVARFMVLRGCTNVVSMAGGIEAWMQDADPAAPAS